MNIKNIIIYFVLIISSIIMIFPFYWMVITSLKEDLEAIKFPPSLIPELKYYIKLEETGELVQIKKPDSLEREKIEVTVLAGRYKDKKLIVNKKEIIKRRFLFENYIKAWKSAPFGIYFFNNIFMAATITLGQIFTSAIAAYAFARLKFPFKNSIFTILLATMMIPGEVILIPNYIFLSKLGWINTYYALIVPFLAGVFSIYFLRQFFETLPKDYFDAAAIDGCSQFRIVFNIAFPLSKPVVLTTGLFQFIGMWNALLWPLIVTNSPEMRTLQVGLAVFLQEGGTYWGLLMAATTFCLLPLVVIFFLTQRQFVKGIAQAGLKG